MEKVSAIMMIKNKAQIGPWLENMTQQALP